MITRKQIEDHYLVLAHGHVYSKRTNRRMVGKIDKYGYRILCLSLDLGVKHVGLHRIVAICWLDNPNNLPQINHKDGDKLNNRVNNLEWCTAKHNTQHSYDTGLSKAWNKNKTGVYSEEQICRMRKNQPNMKPVRVELNGVEIAKYDSMAELCREMGFDERTAMRVLQGKKSYNTIKGHKLYYS